MSCQSGSETSHSFPFHFPLLQVWEAYLGALCMRDTAGALLILEGWLEPEATTSDLRAQRGLFIVGAALVCLSVCLLDVSRMHLVLCIGSYIREGAASPK